MLRAALHKSDSVLLPPLLLLPPPVHVTSACGSTLPQQQQTCLQSLLQSKRRSARNSEPRTTHGNVRPLLLSWTCTCAGTAAEMVCPGGELAFVMQMVEESEQLQDRVHWWVWHRV